MAKTIFSAITKSYVAPVDNRGGWFPWIREPYSGAWQRNDEWTVDSVLAYQAVYSCITLIANDIAKMPIRAMKRMVSGILKGSDLALLDNLFKTPNSYQNRIQFIQWWAACKLIWGNAYILKVKDPRGRIIELHVLDPNKVTVMVSPSGMVFYQLGEDMLSGVDRTDVTVPASEIIHDRMNCLYHPLVGISPLYASGLAASHGLEIQSDSKQFFENGSRPGGVLSAPGSISDDTARRLKEYWDSNFTGAKAGKVAVVGDGLKYEQIRMNATDAQMIEQLKWSAEVVCSAFHVPPYKIGVGPSPSDVEAANQEYYSNCLQILIEQMELCIDEGIEIPNGYKSEFNIDALIRMDSAKKIRNLTESVKGSLFSVDEARHDVGKEPVPGGNSIYMQQQNFSLEALAKRDATDNPFDKGSSNSPSNPEADDVPADDEELERAAKYLAYRMHQELASGF